LAVDFLPWSRIPLTIIVFKASRAGAQAASSTSIAATIIGLPRFRRVVMLE
jgi:hypothetical protein